MTSDQILRWPHVKDLTGLSRSTVWRLERQDQFPQRVQIGLRAVGWKKSEIQFWIKNRSGYAGQS